MCDDLGFDDLGFDEVATIALEDDFLSTIEKDDSDWIPDETND